MLCGSVSGMIEDLQPSSPEETLREASQGLVSPAGLTIYTPADLSCPQLSILDGSGELQDHFVFAHGMLAVLEVLETKPSRDVTLNLLKIVNMVGGITSCCRYCIDRHVGRL
jgi:hypothetical protein